MKFSWWWDILPRCALCIFQTKKNVIELKGWQNVSDKYFSVHQMLYLQHEWVSNSEVTPSLWVSSDFNDSCCQKRVPILTTMLEWKNAASFHYERCALCWIKTFSRMDVWWVIVHLHVSMVCCSKNGERIEESLVMSSENLFRPVFSPRNLTKRSNHSTAASYHRFIFILLFCTWLITEITDANLE